MKLPNIVVRILAGAVFVGLLVGGILINEYTFIAVFSLIIGLALYEFYGLIEKNAKVPISKALNIVGGILMLLGGYLSYTYPTPSMLVVFLPYLTFLLVLFVSELYLKRENPIQSLAYSVMGQVYIALPFTLANALVLGVASTYTFIFLLAVLVFIWVNDSFAYLTGMAFGKHKMFERISPKKTWEGFVGGTVFAIAASLVFHHFVGAKSVFVWVVFAVVVVVFGTLGDLIESLMKRTLGVKDSGNMIPGHGGILDRFDSTIFAILAAVVYLNLLAFFSWL